MKRYDVDRIAEVKYRACVEQVIARLKGLPGDVWSCFCGSLQRGDPSLSEETNRQVEQTCLEVVRACADLEAMWFGSDALWKDDDDSSSSRAGREEGVVKELYERVRYAAGDAPFARRDEQEKSTADGPGFRFDEDDLVFLMKVARKLAHLAEQPSVALEHAKAIRRAVAALKKLPDRVPEVNVEIEVTHRMGDAGFSETYNYAIKLDRQRIDISSAGSQYDPDVGATSFSLESLEWHANGQTAHQGNRDTWLERLEYALAHDFTVKVKDESAGSYREPVQGATG
jgi:hypothetical protein